MTSMAYRLNPVDLRAVQFTGFNHHEVGLFTRGRAVPAETPRGMLLRGIEGELYVALYAWIVQGVLGEFHLLSDGAFRELFHPTDS